MRTVYEWCVIHGVIIRDPDGWRNAGIEFDLSQRMDEALFNSLMMPSTVEISQVVRENERLRMALRNCLALSRLKKSDRAGCNWWEHIQRFCAEVGISPSILRGQK